MFPFGRLSLLDDGRVSVGAPVFGVPPLVTKELSRLLDTRLLQILVSAKKEMGGLECCIKGEA